MRITKRMGLLLALLMVLMLALTACSSTAPASTPAPKAKTPDWPQKPISMIVPAAAGGGTDIIARKFAAIMEKDLGQPVVIVNKGGGGTLIGLGELQGSKPDGYTIGWATNSLVTARHVSKTNISYKNFDYIAYMNADPASITINKDLPYKTLPEFIKAAKEEPGKFKIANGGPNGIWHVIAMQFAQKTGTSFKHVPFEGANPALIAVAGGHVDATVMSLVESKQMLEGGLIRVLAIMADKRDPKFPDVPTAKELGVDIVAGTWRGIIAPKGIDPIIIARLEKSVKTVVDTAEFKKFMQDNGFGLTYSDGKSFEEIVAREDAMYENLLKGIKK